MEVNNCILTSVKFSKYGNLPVTVAKEIPWNKRLVDFIDHMD